MVLLSRQVNVQKSHKEIYQIIKTFPHYFSKEYGDKESFSMHCAIRYNGSLISLIKVTGKIRECSPFIIITISTHADLSFYIGCFLSLVGLLGILWCYLSFSLRWVPCLGALALGLFVSSQSIWKGKDLLDRLERKLLD